MMIETATGETLDNHADLWGVKPRMVAEPDAAFRERILNDMNVKFGMSRPKLYAPMQPTGPSHRIGEFSIRRAIIDESPELALSMLAGMIVVRAELQWHTNAVHYQAIHPDFEEVHPAQQPPHYVAEMVYIHDETTGRHNAKFLRWHRL